MRQSLKVLAAAGLVAGFAAAANAATLSVDYGWEDGTGTILGSFGNLANPDNVTTGDEVSADSTISTGVTPYAGSRMLTVSEDPHDSTPQAYIAYIENLSDGDTVTASFYGWDSTSSSPSERIWGHWASNGDINSYGGSAGGNSTYTDGSGWSQVSYTWDVTSGNEALVIELRLYSSPSTADVASTYFADNLHVEVTSTSPNVSITTPGGVTALPEPASLGLFAIGGLMMLKRRRAA